MERLGRRGRSQATAARLTQAAFLVALALSACAQAQPSLSPAETNTPAASAPTGGPSPSPTSTSSPSAEPVTPSPVDAPASAGSSPTAPTAFTSTVYRYRVTLPGEAGAGAWTPAVRPWDGRQTLIRAGPYLDRTLLPQGGVFLTGIATSKDLDGFTEEIISLYQRSNGCQAVTDIREVEINGVPARAFDQSCPEGLRPSRVVMVKDGYGILAFHTANPADEGTALARLIELLDGLEWLPA